MRARRKWPDVRPMSRARGKKGSTKRHRKRSRSRRRPVRPPTPRNSRKPASTCRSAIARSRRRTKKSRRSNPPCARRTERDTQVHRADSLQHDFEVARTTSAKASALNAREATLDKLKAELEAREKRLAQAQAGIDARTRLPGRREEDVTRRESQLAALETETQAASKTLRDRERDLARAEKRVEEKAKSVEGRASRRDMELQERAATLTKLKSELHVQSKALKDEGRGIAEAKGDLERRRAEVDRRGGRR